MVLGRYLMLGNLISFVLGTCTLGATVFDREHAVGLGAEAKKESRLQGQGSVVTTTLGYQRVHCLRLQGTFYRLSTCIVRISLLKEPLELISTVHLVDSKYPLPPSGAQLGL